MQESNEQELNGLESNEFINYINARHDYDVAVHDFMVHARVFSMQPTASNAVYLAKQQLRLSKAYITVNLRVEEHNQLHAHD